MYWWNQSEEEYYNLQVDSDTSYAIKVNVSEYALDKSFGIELFPNPAKQHIQLKTNTSITAITLLDILGQEVRSFTASNNILDLTGIASGQYILKVKTNQGIQMQKLVVE